MAKTPETTKRKRKIDWLSQLVKWTGGEDTLHLALKVIWTDPDRLFATLESEKIRSQEQGVSVVDVAGKSIVMSTKGRGVGDQDGHNTYYKYVFRCNELRYLLMARQGDPDDTMFNVLVRVGSLPFMAMGYQWCVDEFRELLTLLGGKIIKCSVSRVDLALDLPGVKVSTIAKYDAQGQVVSRPRPVLEDFGPVDDEPDQEPRRWAGPRRETTGMMWGRGNVCRIYEKLKEMKDRGTEKVKLPAMLANRYGGKLPKCAARIEFQCGREMLKELQIDTLEDYEQRKQSLVNYLTGKWFYIIRRSDVQRRRSGNLNRCQVNDFWRAVQLAFNQVYSSPVVHQQRIKMRKSTDLNQALAAIAGYMGSCYAIRSSAKPEDYQDIWDLIAPELYDFILNNQDKILKKTQQKWANASGLDAFDDPDMRGEYPETWEDV